MHRSVHKVGSSDLFTVIHYSLCACACAYACACTCACACPLRVLRCPYLPCPAALQTYEEGVIGPIAVRLSASRSSAAMDPTPSPDFSLSAPRGLSDSGNVRIQRKRFEEKKKSSAQHTESFHGMGPETLLAFLGDSHPCSACLTSMSSGPLYGTSSLRPPPSPCWTSESHIKALAFKR